jgi:antitoxin MazE
MEPTSEPPSIRSWGRNCGTGLFIRQCAILTWDTPRVYNGSMTKKLIRHGNSAALVLDKALLELLKVEMNTPLEVTTDGRNIIISPQSEERAEQTLLEVLERINRKHGTVLAKLGK